MRRHLFLYLALACFLALIAIFIIDGYLGIYDTVYVTAGEYEQTIGPDVWLRRDTAWSSGSSWGGKTFFRHEVDNRQLSSYSATIRVSVEKENEKIFDLLNEDIVIDAFHKATVKWTLDSKELESRGFDAGQYTVKVERDGVERKILVDYSYPPVPPKPAPRP